MKDNTKNQAETRGLPHKMSEENLKDILAKHNYTCSNKEILIRASCINMTNHNSKLKVEMARACVHNEIRGTTQNSPSLDS